MPLKDRPSVTVYARMARKAWTLPGIIPTHTHCTLRNTTLHSDRTSRSPLSTRVYSVASDELDLAKQLIDKSTLTIGLSAYKDDYEAAVKKLVKV